MTIGTMTGLSGDIGYGIGVTCEAQVLAEGNYFENVKNPVLISKVNDPGEMLSGDPAGYISAPNNYLVNSDSIVENKSGFNFNPKSFYSYTLMNAQDVKNYVLLNAGAKKIVVAINDIFAGKQKSSSFSLVNTTNSSSLILTFAIGNSQQVNAAAYSISGTRLFDLLNNYYPQGYHQVALDIPQMTTGTYIFKLGIGREKYARQFTINR